MQTSLCALLMLMGTAAGFCFGQSPLGQKASSARIARGELEVLFRDNSESPGVLSGIDSLFNVRSTPGFDAFDPDGRGASAGLNFEHIICGHADPHNAFAPRHGRYDLYRRPDERSIVLVRDAKDDPWAMASTMTYTVREPNSIDFEFKCTPHDRKRFGPRGYAVLFWADYMNDVAEVPIHFRGVEKEGGTETWIAADGPPGHPDWNQGGTYRSLPAKGLDYDANHNFKLNLWSYDWPRFAKPFYYGRAANGMTFILMFDRMHSTDDEIRFSIFKFKLKNHPRPAWDFQYVLHQVEEGKEYGFRGRMVWKKFISSEDCLKEYEDWAARLQRGGATSRPG